MSQIDDLRAAGFSDGEINGYAAGQRGTLAAAGFSDDEINAQLGPPPKPQPDMAAAHAALASNVITHMPPWLARIQVDGDPFDAATESLAHLFSGMVLGFPAYVGTSAGALIDKHALGEDVDPADMAARAQDLVTVKPVTPLGQKMASTLDWPLQKIAELAQAGGQKSSDVAMNMGASPNTAAGIGATADATLQMLPTILLGETVRRAAGRPVTSADVADASKIVAGPGAKPEAVNVVDDALRATYERTGISPASVLDAIKTDPQIAADLRDPAIEIPRALQQFESKAAGPQWEPTPGDGEPLLDTSDDQAPAARETAAVDAEDQPSSAPEKPSVVQLNSGLDPTAALRDVRDSYSPYVGLEHEAPAGSPLMDSLQKIFAPASRGDIAEAQAGIMRENLARMAREREVALDGLKDQLAMFDKMPPEENIKVIDAIERGTPLTDPKLAAAAADLRTLLDAKRDQVRALGKGKLDEFDENYFPHIWKSPEAARATFARRPLEGSKAFLKERTIPYTTDGLRWRAYNADDEMIGSFDTQAEAHSYAGADGRVGPPLEPVTTNPGELALLKAREMGRYVYGQKIFEEMKDAGLAKFVRFGESAPAGWTKLDDRIARVITPTEDGAVLRGEYYAPDQAATLLNNHLTPGLQGNGFYDAFRDIGTAMNTMQLGLSAFHIGFTTMDSMISRVALGVKQISRGDIAHGAANVAIGSSPVQPILNVLKGDRLLRAYLGKLDDPDLAPIVEALQQGGGRVSMDDLYRSTQVNKFKQALRNEDTLAAGKAFLPWLLDRIGAPIFEQLVPRQKLGVFFDMAKDWLAENPEANVAEKRAGLGKLWDSVDNRMGQLVYDNVFWNRALKDALMVTVRSVGWNLGTFRELGGGVVDLKDAIGNRAFSDRSAYLVALPFMTAIYGAIYQYLKTGQAPADAKDLFFPRNGNTRPDGSADRVSLPTYMKDVYAYGQDASNAVRYAGDPTQTVRNKLSPLIATLSQMLNNQDFYGGAIRNPADPAVKQVADEAAYLMQQVEPFSLRNYLQQSKAAGTEPTPLGYLTSPSMIGITPAPGYIVKSDQENESAHVSQLHDELTKKFVEEIKGGADPAKLIPEMLNSGLGKGDIRYILSTSSAEPRPHRLKAFGGAD